MSQTPSESRWGLPETFTYSDARAAGLSDRKLYELRDAGALVVVGGGLYRWADAEPADLDLIEIAERVPRATLCLETALARHGLVDLIPAAIDVAIPRGEHRPVVRAPVRLHTFAEPTFDLGRDTIDVGARRPLGVYGPERSIVDMIRLRHQQGPDLAWEALRRWRAQPGHQPAALLEMASRFKGAETPLRAALEVIL